MSARRHRLYFRLQRAAHLVRKSADREMLRRVGITTAQAAVLHLVADRPGLSQRDLAALLAQNESAMTTMVGRLAGSGLVARRRSERDGRTWAIELTARGREAHAKGRRAFASINAALDRALGGPGVPELAALLDATIDAFSDEPHG